MNEEARKEITNYLFKAAEALREALDIIDLKNISLHVSKKAKLKSSLVDITTIAQKIKRTR